MKTRASAQNQKTMFFFGYLFSIFVGGSAWGIEPPIYLDNTSLASINVDQPYIRVMVSYPGISISGVCSIDIVADSYNRDKPIKNLIEQLEISTPFGKDKPNREAQIISATTARLALIVDTYLDGVLINPRNPWFNLRDIIEETLGKNRRVVVIPRSC